MISKISRLSKYEMSVIGFFVIISFILININNLNTEILQGLVMVIIPLLFVILLILLVNLNFNGSTSFKTRKRSLMVTLILFIVVDLEMMILFNNNFIMENYFVLELIFMCWCLSAVVILILAIKFIIEKYKFKKK